MLLLLLLIVLAFADCEYLSKPVQSCPHPTKTFVDHYYHGNTTHVDRSCNVCPKESSLPHSIPTEKMQKTFQHFANQSPEPVHYYWVDHEGQEHFRRVIPPGTYDRATTYEGHLFRFYNADHSMLLLEYLVGLVPLYNDFSVHSEAPSSTGALQLDEIDRAGEPDWSTVIPTGFVNRAGYNIDVSWVPGDRPAELAGQLQNGQIHREYTYIGHSFQAKVHKTGAILSSVEIKPVEIPDCGRRKKMCSLEIPIAKPVYLKGANPERDDSQDEANGSCAANF